MAFGEAALIDRVSRAAGALPNFEARSAVGVRAEAGSCSPEGSMLAPVVFQSCSWCDAAASAGVCTRHFILQSTAKMNKLLIALALAPAAALVAPSVPRA